MSNVDTLINLVSDFIEEYDDEEAVSLVSTLYLMVLELSKEVSAMTVKNKLLERKLNEEDSEDDFEYHDESKENKSKYSA